MLVPPCRLLFPVAVIWSNSVVTATVSALVWHRRLPLGSAGSWHAHEMMLGFVGGGLADYVLTAMRSWAGRGPLSGRAAQIRPLADRVCKDGLVAMLDLSYLWSPPGLMLESLRRTGSGTADRVDAPRIFWRRRLCHYCDDRARVR
ncbi:MAG: hypothetical protein D6773_13545 [Alphaproteobacteria bacterium]|nr:MAG: hypothetical protein D6773_13545 [Alphaproteobacteria bacterium]